jgi:trk system potassium uptake protein TrkH
MLLSGIMLTTEAIFFLVRGLSDIPLDPDARFALFATGGLGLIAGTATWRLTRRGSLFLGRREAMLLVGLSWIVGAAFSGLPYLIWAHRQADVAVHPFHDYVNCYFEAMSGLTTTGATVLTDIGAVPASLLLWRSFTHWLGGIGIVVLFVAVLPSLGMGGKRLFQIEAPGPSQEGVRPQVRETARALLYIYIALTTACALAFVVAGMPAFESICHAFSTLSTGGLSTRDASLGAYDSAAVDLIASFFMLAAGVNFGLFYWVLKGRMGPLLRDPELRVYLVTKVLVIAVVAIDLLGQPIVMTTGRVVDGTFGEALRFSTFVTVALHTGTGFCTADYDTWPLISRTILVGLIFIGGCAGSTAGGVKVIRVWIAFKVVLAQLERAFRPNVVRPLRIGGAAVDPDMKIAAMSYLLMMFLLIGAGMFLVALFEPAGGGRDLMTTFTASLSTACNVGPGLYGVGATQTYEPFTDASKIVFSLLMALGRLEMFALLVLFMPSFWRRD